MALARARSTAASKWLAAASTSPASQAEVPARHWAWADSWMPPLRLEGGGCRREGRARAGPLAESGERVAESPADRADEGRGVLAQHRERGLEQLGCLDRAARLDVGEAEEALAVGEEHGVAQPGRRRHEVGRRALELDGSRRARRAPRTGRAAGGAARGRGGRARRAPHARGRARRPRPRPREPAGCARRGASRAAPARRRPRARWRRAVRTRRPGRSAPGPWPTRPRRAGAAGAGRPCRRPLPPARCRPPGRRGCRTRRPAATCRPPRPARRPPPGDARPLGPGRPPHGRRRRGPARRSWRRGSCPRRPRGAPARPRTAGPRPRPRRAGRRRGHSRAGRGGARARRPAR